MKIVLRIVAGVLVVFGLGSMAWGFLAPLVALFFSGNTELFSARGAGFFVATRAGVGVVATVLGAVMFVTAARRAPLPPVGR
jgi:hypothetical protein